MFGIVDQIDSVLALLLIAMAFIVGYLVGTMPD